MKSENNTPNEWDLLAEEWDENRQTPSSALTLFEQHVRGLVLDAGCGNGRNSRQMAKTADRVIALDSSTKMLEKAKKKIRDVKNAKIVHADMQSIPLENNSINTIVCLAAFHHLVPKNQPKAAAEFFRVLSPGGSLCLAVWNRQQSRFKNKPKELNVPWGEKPRYYYFFDENELLGLLQNAGFQIENVTYEKNGTKTDVLLASNICIVASKPRL